MLPQSEGNRKREPRGGQAMPQDATEHVALSHLGVLPHIKRRQGRSPQLGL